MARPLVEAFKKIILDLAAEIDWKELVAQVIAALIGKPEVMFTSSDPKIAELGLVLADCSDEDKTEIVQWLQAGATAE